MSMVCYYGCGDAVIWYHMIMGVIVLFVFDKP